MNKNNRFLPSHGNDHDGNEMNGTKMGAPVVKDLVLVGGGHTHVEVVRSFGMKPMDGVRVTLVTRDVHTPYSGMLPGFVSGFYKYDECHIDLARLSSWAKARLIHVEASGIDTKARRVQFAGRPSIPYDVLSIDIGITPGSEQVPGARQHTIPVKPIDRCHRLEDERASRKHQQLPPAEITIVCRGHILAGHTGYAQRAFIGIMRQKGIKVIEHRKVVRVDEGMLTVEAPKNGSHMQNGGGAQANGEGHALQQQLLQDNDNTVPFDACMLCTQASAAPWLKLTGLPTDPQGFLAINECLQSDGGPPEVFAAGDVASCAKHPRPKAGVFAVRQGPPLSANLRRFLSGEPLEPFVPQKSWLSLVTTGDKYCVGTKGWIGLQGAWLWTLKDYIDRAFMRKYGEDLPDMMKMMSGPPPPGKLLVQSVDFFRAFWDDPYILGKIAANHALGDVWAMGAKPVSALALAVVPLMTDRLVAEELTQLLSGAVEVNATSNFCKIA
ncbi:hypothetical protein DUNSADRAFT_1285 [Dunaliella salina]|uniref:FAD/NAD(P)-binding domain-containing protein n=1 Tax=Dunaliella salina TaxID=3046 RepID=A0ABQ7GXC4_DUNSA|nr:hypothetical protein DUNSADRAFT_1285 [Dunaliella salina]|eukprot:KAF5839251.1 hypothetical protein DUNSADRAFT_1285 [Dunaliella salina]